MSDRLGRVGTMDRLSNSEIAAAGLTDWRKLAQGLHARFTGDAGEIASLAAVLAAEIECPSFTVGRGYVDVRLHTEQDGRWVTAETVAEARRVSELAHERGLTPAPGEVTQLELALDTARAAEIGPFWAALLTGSADNTIHGEVFDPTGRVPVVWFQESEPRDPAPQRWHYDLWLAPEVATTRIEAAVAAGGTIEYADEAPAFTVLADPDGNRVCICTSLDRG